MFQDSEELRQQLVEEMFSFELSLSDEQIGLLLKHLDLVVEKNKVVNLTRITDPVSALRLHVLDSLLITKVLPQKRKFVDIGTGAGFPGIPFAIATGSNGILLDSVGKKISAVNEFIDELGLQKSLRGVNGRAEEVVKNSMHVYDLVIARAVAPLNVLVEYASPFLHHDGLFLAAKSNIREDELSDGLSAARLCGLTNVSRETFELPYNSGHRELILFKKTATEKVKLPRRNGMAKNDPLC